LNGIELEDANEDLYDMMIQVSGGGLSKEEIAIILERLVV
jgi:prophage maintenance system killer protein